MGIATLLTPPNSVLVWKRVLIIAGTTWTPPPGCYSVIVKRLQAAGAASGSKGTTNTDIPGAGGAGECLLDRPLTCTPGVDLTLTGLGTAGVAAASGSNNGGDGPDVSISNGTDTLTARGGKGGKAGNNRNGGAAGGSLAPGGGASGGAPNPGSNAHETVRALSGGSGAGGTTSTTQAGAVGGGCSEFAGGVGGGTDGSRSGGPGGGASAFGDGGNGGTPSGGTTGQGSSPAATSYGAAGGAPSGGTAAAAGKDGIKGAIELIYPELVAL